MKINSYDLGMQSQHAFHRSSIESEVMFSSFMFDKQSLLNSPPIPQENKIPPRLQKGQLPSIDSIIQSLLNSLNSRTSKNTQELDSPVALRRLSLFQRFEESESLEFSTSGKVQTDKGSFDINLNVSMSRSFVIQNQIDVSRSFDPLVISIHGGIPDLSSDTFSFDLDNDGESEQISKLKAGSGFLALDKNNDGTINQGNELFGTITGNGFYELAQYDKDENQWIDENDSIFDKLRIWFKNEETNEKELVGLGEVGVGAIFLGSNASEFTYKTTTNQTLGEMKSCSVFLNEDGTCGNVSQIDFATSKEEPLSTLLQS